MNHLTTIKLNTRYYLVLSIKLKYDNHNPSKFHGSVNNQYKILHRSSPILSPAHLCYGALLNSPLKQNDGNSLSRIRLRLSLLLYDCMLLSYPLTVIKVRAELTHNFL